MFKDDPWVYLTCFIISQWQDLRMRKKNYEAAKIRSSLFFVVFSCHHSTTSYFAFHTRDESIFLAKGNRIILKQRKTLAPTCGD